MTIYTVKPGDSIDAIAAKYGVPAERIIYVNQLTYPYRIAVGQALLITFNEIYGGTGIIANGFAYPFISPWVLEQTLPFLTELSVFSYGFTIEGDLVNPVLPTEWMIRAAIDYGVSPVLTLTPFGPDGQFNNYLIHRMLSDTESRNRLIRNIYDAVLYRGYEGVNIDFEFILAEDRDLFTEFVRDVTYAINELGYEVTVDLAPKTSADQPGLLYEGKDYPALGEAANRVLIMTYEWGYTYGPAMAVAPINKVREVIEYAVTEIPPEKISMGVPNYGYDWPLPYVRGESKAKTIGNIEALQIAVNNNVEILFDETSKAPYFSYVSNGVTHEVWFEDARSILAKYRLRDEYGLHGIGCWQIMQLFRVMWILAQGDIWSISIE
ncbi:MAG: LysM peptidoglycan-binding domain-containing protein [Lachnospiraceae bacterium]|nr:LysM peptidoglycan-binding domain-containing protein [Lachnospiraceae bacterium]